MQPLACSKTLENSKVEKENVRDGENLEREKTTEYSMDGGGV